MGMHVRQCLQYMCACLLPKGSNLSVSLAFICGFLSESTGAVRRFSFFFLAPAVKRSIPLALGKLFCWLDCSSNRIWLCSCCHHHNLPLWIIMAEKQHSLWLSTVLCRPFLSVFILALIWWHTRSHNAEPECCDDLHWDLWGIGGHGNGLLCLLVSSLWERWSKTSMDCIIFTWTCKRERCENQFKA